MATKLTASGSNLLVKYVNPREMKTKEGLVLPQDGKARGVTLYGEVKSVGEAAPHTFDEKKTGEPPRSRPLYPVGTIVVFERSRCYEIQGTTATLAFLSAADVLGTVEFDDAPEEVEQPKPEPSRIVKPGFN